jgi:hypothetical protein
LPLLKLGNQGCPGIGLKDVFDIRGEESKEIFSG